MRYRKHPERSLNHWLSLPFIYMMIIPFIFLDITMESYHRICFPLYGIHCVRRSAYIKIDRHKLKYIGWIDRIHCAYCGYANGLLPYCAAIAAETEKYWCGIKHKETKGFIPPKHHKDFVKYGDEKALKKKY